MDDTRDMTTTIYNQTDRFSGKCEFCIYPVVHSDLHKFRLGEYDGTRSLDGLRNNQVGSTVTLTADVEPSKDDAAFAFGKRPRKATLQEKAEVNA